MQALNRLWARWLHWIFEASLLIKGLLAASEGLGGLGLLLAPNTAVAAFVGWMTRNEIAQDPGDHMALWLQQKVAAFSIETQHFYALYLCLHGGLKLAMVFGLARQILWAYPAAMAILAGFVAYQMHHFALSPSPVLLALSGLDALMIVLVWREYRILRAAHAPG
ncbi:MAG: DUF2127 domain-containing protein [Paracoccaceae bacterium]|nr:DUF2127 domain-containing protein [Paracoccaceae bacterium]